jgi:hypothetical protein
VLLVSILLLLRNYSQGESGESAPGS